MHCDQTWPTDCVSCDMHQEKWCSWPICLNYNRATATQILDSSIPVHAYFVFTGWSFMPDINWSLPSGHTSNGNKLLEFNSTLMFETEIKTRQIAATVENPTHPQSLMWYLHWYVTISTSNLCRTYRSRMTQNLSDLNFDLSWSLKVNSNGADSPTYDLLIKV